MTNTAVGAGIGTSGLVGQFGAFCCYGTNLSNLLVLVEILLMHFILPAVLVLAISLPMRKLGWIKPQDVTLQKVE